MNLSRRMRLGPPGPRGLVLVLVLVVVAMLSLAGFSFTDLMVTEVKATRSVGHELQARQLLASGATYLQSLVALRPEELEQFGGLEDNPARLRAVEVFRDERTGLTGRFTVLAPPDPSSSASATESTAAPRYGMADESAKLNLAALVEWDHAQAGAGRKALMNLPGMTTAAADALLDWCDADSNPREQGAEVDYYSGLEPGYGPRNGPLDTLAELLLVRDVTPESLFGRDANRNGVLDEAELTVAEPTAGDRATTSEAGTAPRGWSTWITLHSAEAMTDGQGNPRIQLNGDLKQLHEALAKRFNQAIADFAVLYRQYGPATSSPKPGQISQVDLSQPARFNFSSIFDLAGAKVVVQKPGEANGVLVDSPLGTATDALRGWLPDWLDAVMLAAAPRVGRVNVNRASREVLLGVPGLEATEADALIAKREGQTSGQRGDRARQTAAWLVTEGIVPFDKFRKLNDYVTGAGAVFRTQLIAFFDEVPLTLRAEVVLDATQTPARVVSWQDFQRLGQAYEAAVIRGEEDRSHAALSGR
ncbi:MAG: general secretion pathway protein GspK [Pirellulales bacterium]|nr:general secretion pathway protein GspK [Pirellulales bacterium]